MLSPHLGRTFSWLLPLLGAAMLHAQTPPPPPIDPALPDQLKELKTLVADTKMAMDFQAIGLVQKLTQGVEQRNPKDKERLAKGLAEVFRTGKVRPPDKDVLYRETADALAKFGADGGRELQKVVVDARFKDAIQLQAHLILAIGRTQDDKQVDWLLEQTLRSSHDEIRAAAGEALGAFTAVDVKVRREVVKGMIREWGSLHQQATTRDSTDPNAPIDPAPQNARRTLQAVEGKWIATLQKLTGQQHAAFEDWQRWLNKNPAWTPAGSR